MAWIIDLDGVVWLARSPIAGAVEAIGRLRDAGIRLVFASNFSHGTRAEMSEALARVGVVTGDDDVCTSAMAAGTLVGPGERVHVLGGPGVVEAVEGAGAGVVPAGSPADAAIVGWAPEIDFAGLDGAFQAVRRGARLIATNTDPTYPTPTGPVPGAGAIVAAVERAAGCAATVAGKPHPPMAALVRQVAAAGGQVVEGAPGPTTRSGTRVAGPTDVMVGDRPSTDGRFAAELQIPFALVLSGVTSADDVVTPRPTYRAADLADLVDALVPAAPPGSRRGR